LAKGAAEVAGAALVVEAARVVVVEAVPVVEAAQVARLALVELPAAATPTAGAVTCVSSCRVAGPAALKIAARMHEAPCDPNAAN